MINEGGGEGASATRSFLFSLSESLSSFPLQYVVYSLSRVVSLGRYAAVVQCGLS